MGAIAPVSGQATGTPAASAGSDEKVTVTARKRSEQARDIPGAISAVTSEEKRNLALDGMQDYIRQVPGASLVTSGPEYLNDFSLRGSGAGRLGFSETATGIYKDGNYSAGGGFGGRSLNRLDLFDIDRVEILRGPQGALYGRNSVGGAINVIATKPDDAFGAFAEIGYQDPDRTSIEGIINLAFSEQVRARFGGFIDDQASGHHINLTTGNNPDEQHFAGARATVDWTPAIDTLFRLVYEYYDGTTPAFANIGHRATSPANAGALPIDPDPYTRNFMNREGTAKVTEDSFFFTFEQDLDFADLTVKLNRRDRSAGRTNEDLDHFAGFANYLINGQTVDLISAQFEEFQRTGMEAYLSSADDGPWRWLIGVEAQLYTDNVLLDPGVCPAYSAVGAPVFVPGCTPGSAVAANPDAGPAGQALTAAQVAAVLGGARGNLTHDDFNEELTSYSLFGSLDYDFSEAWTGGLELRIQKDEKDFLFRRWTVDPIVFFGAGAPPAGRAAETVVNGNPSQFCPPQISGTPDCVADGGVSRDTLVLPGAEEWTVVTPAATLKVDLNPTDTAYARFATGYRPGGFNINLPAGLSRAELTALIGYDPEYVYSYELGWKGSLLGAFVVDIAGFYNITNEAQQVSAPSALARGFLLQNAGDTRVWGVELEARTRFALGNGTMLMTLAASSIDGEFQEGARILLDTNGDGIPDIVNLEGFQVPRLRDYQVALNATYMLPLGGNWTGLAAFGVQAADGGFETPNNTRAYEGYTLFDARLALLKDNWRLTAFGKNLSDERYRLNEVALNNYFSEPRVFGVELGYNYKE